MNRLLLVLALIATMSIATAERIHPMTDVLTTNSDGEYVKIFGPETFYFDGAGFWNPVVIHNGTAYIGDMNARR